MEQELADVKNELVNVENELANVKSELANVESELANVKNGSACAKRKLVFIYNSHAGRAQIRPALADILDTFAENDYEIHVVPTRKRGDAYDAAKHCASDVDLLVCSGGDGTLNEVVGGMLKRPEGRLPVGYIPAGSTNDFATSLCIPFDMRKAAQCIMKDDLFRCDVGQFNDRYFVYVAGFGMFTDVSYDTDQNLKNVLGHMAYVIEALRRLTDVKSYTMRIECDGQMIEDKFLVGLVCSSKSIGGIKGLTGRDVAMDDGLFEVLLVRDPQLDISIQDIVTSLSNGDVPNYIYSFKTSRLKITTEDDVPWTLDGEYGGNPKEVEIVNLHKVLDIHV